MVLPWPDDFVQLVVTWKIEVKIAVGAALLAGCAQAAEIQYMFGIEGDDAADLDAVRTAVVAAGTLMVAEAAVACEIAVHAGLAVLLFVVADASGQVAVAGAVAVV